MDKTQNNLEEIKKFQEKYISKFIVDDGNNKLLWKDKAPTPNEVLDFFEQLTKGGSNGKSKDITRQI